MEGRVGGLVGRLGWREGTRLRAQSWVEGARHRTAFDGLRTYCLFVGHPRSGSTLLGSLLDAHPDALIAHEARIFKWLDQGWGRTPLLGHLLRRERWFVQRGQQWSGYDYRVPGQWQGRWRRLSVIGDKQAGHTAAALANDPGFTARLRARLRLEVRALNVVRNPYDNLATIQRRRPDQGLPAIPLGHLIDEYFDRAAAIDDLRADPAVSVLDVYHERLVDDPRGQLEAVCRHLDLEPEPGFLDACSQIVFRSPRRSRDSIGWTAGDIDAVARRSAAIDFLSAYTYD